MEMEQIKNTAGIIISVDTKGNFAKVGVRLNNPVELVVGEPVDTVWLEFQNGPDSLEVSNLRRQLIDAIGWQDKYTVHTRYGGQGQWGSLTLAGAFRQFQEGSTDWVLPILTPEDLQGLIGKEIGLELKLDDPIKKTLLYRFIPASEVTDVKAPELPDELDS